MGAGPQLRFGQIPGNALTVEGSSASWSPFFLMQLCWQPVRTHYLPNIRCRPDERLAFAGTQPRDIFKTGRPAASRELIKSCEDGRGSARDAACAGRQRKPWRLWCVRGRLPPKNNARMESEQRRPWGAPAVCCKKTSGSGRQKRSKQAPAPMVNRALTSPSLW